MASPTSGSKLLEQTSWFADCSQSLRDALAAKMTLAEVDDGHIFVEEGKPIKNVMIIEEGTLARTKLSVDENVEESVMALDFSSEAALEASVVVDEISGKGRVTGMLHVMDEEAAFAYATVRAKGPAKVWLIDAAEFRDAISCNPQHALDAIRNMAKTMRVGSKSLRGLVKSTRAKGADTSQNSKGSFCKVLCYDSTSWVKEGFNPAVDAFNATQGEDGCKIVMDYTADRLGERSATFAAGYDAVCLFVNDNANAAVLRTLSLMGVQLVAMRCAGFDRVDTKAARAHGLTVARVPAYSPYAVAEHAIALLMSVNRKIHRASSRVKMANFTLDAGLMGIDIHGKTVGVMGTGKIGQILCNILLGFGANVICYDVFENEEIMKAGGVYKSKEEIFESSSVIFLMMPLLPATRHTINDSVLPKLKEGVIIINTARGALIDTKALLSGLQSGIIGGCGMDVYENEADYFFQDWSARNIKDPDLVSLLGNNNVVLTAHQAFFTKEAVTKIVDTTVENIRDFKKGLKGQAHPNNCIPPMDM